MKIWHRFFLRSLIGSFIFNLTAALFLYIVVDLSINGMSFFTDGNGIKQMLFYYFRHLSIYWDLFATFSFLLACLKVISSAALHLEWSALQMGGLSSKKLLLPFFLFALFLAVVSICNSEFATPVSGKMTVLDSKAPTHQVHTLLLKDKTELVYKSFENDVFLDLFWIKSGREIWHLDELCYSTKLCKNVDILEISDGIKEIGHLDELVCDQIEFTDDWERYKMLSPEWYPISSLFSDHFPNPAESRTYLHRKLAQPFLPFLALLGIAPSLLFFQRRYRLFLITALSLLAFFASYTILEGLHILGENRVLPPSIAIWGPFVGIGSLLGARFKKAF